MIPQAKIVNDDIFCMIPPSSDHYIHSSNEFNVLSSVNAVMILKSGVKNNKFPFIQIENDYHILN
jgi:hypothetical protein